MKVLIVTCVLSVFIAVCKAECTPASVTACEKKTIDYSTLTLDNICSVLSGFKTCATSAGCSDSVIDVFDNALVNTGLDVSKCCAGTAGVPIVTFVTVVLARFLSY